MKNKEKYAKEIVEIACSGDVLAVCKATGKPIGCENNSCEDCDRYNDFLCFRKERLKEWAESEYIEKPVISKKDRAFLSFIKDIYPYIARDEDGALRLYSKKPFKVERGTGLILFQFNIELPMVKWSDEEPWSIEDLKKLEVVEEYE